MGGGDNCGEQITIHPLIRVHLPHWTSLDNWDLAVKCGRLAMTKVKWYFLFDFFFRK